MEIKKIEKGYGAGLKITLGEAEELFAEPGAIATLAGDFNFDTVIYGGLGKALLRGLGARESIFVNKIIGKDKTDVVVAPPIPGDVAIIDVPDDGLWIGDGAYIGHVGNLDLDIKFFGLTGLISGHGLAIMHVTGQGKVFVSAPSGIEERQVMENEKIMIDNTCLVAAEGGIDFHPMLLRKKGGGLLSVVKSGLFSGEGIMFELTGKGRLYYTITGTKSLIGYILKFVRKR